MLRDQNMQYQFWERTLYEYGGYMFWQICCWRVSWSEYCSGRCPPHYLTLEYVRRANEMSSVAWRRNAAPRKAAVFVS